MAIEYEIVVRIPHPPKSSSPHHWRKIGIASKTKEGNGFNCSIEAIPLNWDGNFFIFEVKAETEYKRKDSRRKAFRDINERASNIETDAEKNDVPW